MNKGSFALFGLIWVLLFATPVLAGESPEPSGRPVFQCLPWEVGQFVEYQVIHFENEGGNNRYKIALVRKETIDGKVYFWEQIDIFEYVYYKKGELFKKNITFLALVEPLTSDKFNRDITRYIRDGFLPRDAIKLKVQLSDGPFLEVDPSEYFSYQHILEGTAYSRLPDAMGKIDFSRLKFANGNEQVTVPAGVLECGHVLVSTDFQKEYFDEGFDLWRSPKVPLLGIVKMDFSKTSYWDKWFYRNQPREIHSIGDLFHNLFNKRILGRIRADTYTAQLIDYGPKEKR